MYLINNQQTQKPKNMQIKIVQKCAKKEKVLQEERNRSLWCLHLWSGGKDYLKYSNTQKRGAALISA